MNRKRANKTEWTRLEFKKMVGYPQIPVCGACGGMGDHRMKGGGFYCKMDYGRASTAAEAQWLADSAMDN